MRSSPLIASMSPRSADCIREVDQGRSHGDHNKLAAVTGASSGIELELEGVEELDATARFVPEKIKASMHKKMAATPRST